MKKYARLIRVSVLWMLAMLLVLQAMVSCGPENVPSPSVSESATAKPSQEQTPSPTSGKTEEEPEPVYRIKREDLPKYQIVCAGDVASDLSEALYRFQVQLQKALGIRLAITRDSIVEPDENGYEILVGNTNRAISKSVMEPLRAEDYGYRVIGHTIVVAGYTASSLEKALSSLLHSLSLDEAGSREDFITSEQNYFYLRKEYPLKDLKINGTSLKEFVLVYSPTPKGSEEKFAKEVQDFLASYAGYYLPLLPVNKVSEEAHPFRLYFCVPEETCAAIADQDEKNHENAYLTVKGTHACLHVKNQEDLYFATQLFQNYLSTAEKENDVLCLQEGTCCWAIRDGNFGEMALKTGKAMKIATKPLFYVNDKISFGNYYGAQGGCTDGTYIYTAFINDSDKGYIVKTDLATGKKVAQSEPLALDHGNDLLYNPYTHEIGVAHCFVHSKRVTFLDADTLQFKYEKDLYGSWAGISYNANLRRYAMYSGEFVIYDDDFVMKKKVPVEVSTRYTCQGMDCDDNLLYVVYSWMHSLLIHDWNGKYKNLIEFIDQSDENEHMFHTGENYYIGYASGKVSQMILGYTEV